MRMLDKLIEKLEKIHKLLRTSERVDELNSAITLLRAQHRQAYAKLRDIEKRTR